MPTVFREKGYRFFFYSNDHLPKYVHVEKENKTAKFKIGNAELVRSKRFTANELSEIRKIILKNLDVVLRRWDEYFTD
jgi:hypothetical protein